MGRQAGRTADEVAAATGFELPPESPASLAQVWAGELDERGVKKAALIASVPGDEESVAAALAACPFRFFGYFMLNPLEDGAVERTRAAFAHGMNAVCMFPAMHRYSVGDECAGRIFQEVAAHPGRAVFVHCGVLTVGIRKKLGLPSLFDMRYSNPLDLHPIALRYPQVPFIIPHFGAGYFREALMLADLCPNVYLDTSSTNSWMHYEGLDLTTVFRRAINSVGASRLLFGTDSSFFPRGWNYDIFEAQTKALVDLGASDGDARLILGGNLQRIFPEPSEPRP